jgi:hypothetical protein
VNPLMHRFEDDHVIVWTRWATHNRRGTPMRQVMIEPKDDDGRVALSFEALAWILRVMGKNDEVAYPRASGFMGNGMLTQFCTLAIERGPRVALTWKREKESR